MTETFGGSFLTSGHFGRKSDSFIRNTHCTALCILDLLASLQRHTFQLKQRNKAGTSPHRVDDHCLSNLISGKMHHSNSCEDGCSCFGQHRDRRCGRHTPIVVLSEESRRYSGHLHNGSPATLKDLCPKQTDLHNDGPRSKRQKLGCSAAKTRNSSCIAWLWRLMPLLSMWLPKLAVHLDAVVYLSVRPPVVHCNRKPFTLKGA